MDLRIFILLVCYVAATALAAPQRQNLLQPEQAKDPKEVKILKQINKLNDDGSYTYGYEADDGSFKVETRDTDGVVKGKYGFVDSNGELKTVEYTAGEKSAKSSKGRSDLDDQSIAAQTPKGNTVNSGTGSATDQDDDDDDEATSSEDTSEGTKPNNNRGATAGQKVDFGSFGSQQGGAPLVYSQQQLQGQGQGQGQPGGFGGFNGINGNPYVTAGQEYGGGPGPQVQYSGGRSQYVGQPQPGQYSGFGQQVFGQQGGGPGSQISAQQLGALQAAQQQQQRQYPGDQSGGQPFSNILPGGQFSGGQGQGPSSSGFPIASNAGANGRSQFAGPRALSAQGQAGAAGAGNDEDYVPNVQLDGYSEDADEDGYVDTAPGSAGITRASSSDEKADGVKTAEGPQFASRPLSTPPQQVLRVQNNPTLQGQQRPGQQRIVFSGGPGQGQGGQGGPGFPQGGPGPYQQQPQLSEEQLQALYQQLQQQQQLQGQGPQEYQGQGSPLVQGQPGQGRPGQGVPLQYNPQSQQFNQFNPALYQQQQQQQLQGQGFPGGPQGPYQFSPQQQQGQGFPGQQQPGFPIQQQQAQGFPGAPGVQQFSQGPGGPQFSPGPGQGGFSQIQGGGGFVPSNGQGQSSFPGQQQQGVSAQQYSPQQQQSPFGAAGGGQQFAPVQNFLPGQGSQGQQIPPQYLQQGQGQQYSPQQGGGPQGGSGLQSPGFPFDYGPFGGGFQGGPGGPGGPGYYPGQFGGPGGPQGGPGGFGLQGIQGGQPGQLQGQGQYLLGGGGQGGQPRGVVSGGSGSASADKPIQVAQAEQDKKST